MKNKVVVDSDDDPSDAEHEDAVLVDSPVAEPVEEDAVNAQYPRLPEIEVYVKEMMLEDHYGNLVPIGLLVRNLKERKGLVMGRDYTKPWLRGVVDDNFDWAFLHKMPSATVDPVEYTEEDKDAELALLRCKVLDLTAQKDELKKQFHVEASGHARYQAMRSEVKKLLSAEAYSKMVVNVEAEALKKFRAKMDSQEKVYAKWAMRPIQMDANFKKGVVLRKTIAKEKRQAALSEAAAKKAALDLAALNTEFADLSVGSPPSEDQCITPGTIRSAFSRFVSDNATKDAAK